MGDRTTYARGRVEQYLDLVVVIGFGWNAIIILSKMLFMDAVEINMTIIETISSLSTVLYGITFLFIVNEVKKMDSDFVKNAIKNPLWPRTKLGTIFTFYEIYYKSKGFNLILALNLLSFCMAVIGLVLTILT